MQNEEFIKIEEKLLNERNIHQGVIDEIEEEIDLFDDESRKFNSLLLIFIIHILFLVLTFISKQILQIPTSIINFLSFIMPICSSGIGISLELILNSFKQQKLEVLDLYSRMKYHEIIEEVVSLKIEKELFLARNSAIDKALESSREYQKLLTEIFDSNQINSFCSIDTYGIEDLENDIKLYNDYFEEKYDKLENLITKKIIIESFGLNKSRKTKFFNFLASSAFESFIPCMLYGSLGYLFNIQFNLPYLIPISFLVSLIYKLNNKKDERLSLGNLINKLKPELPINISSSYVDNLDKEIENIITSISNNLKEFTKEKILLEEKINVKLEKEKENETFKRYLNTPTASLDEILSNYLVVKTIDEEFEGPKLVKKR